MVAYVLAGLRPLVNEWLELDGNGLFLRVKPGESKLCRRHNKKADGKWWSLAGRLRTIKLEKLKP